MKKIIEISALFICITCYGQTVNPTVTKNYIHKIVYKKEYQELQLNTAPSSDKLETINYFDALGRALQSINLRQGGKNSINNENYDIVNHFEYDAYGRQDKEYLPFSSSDNNGEFEYTPLTNIESYYLANYLSDLDSSSPNPYSNKVFDNTPLNRIYGQGAPGKDWRANGGLGNVNLVDPNHFIRFDYQTNIANEVLMFNVIFPTGNTEQPQVFYNGFYDENTLYKTITKDENWEDDLNPNTLDLDHTTEEFKDKQGRVILKRTYNNNLTHDTYYIYDDFGNLTYVLSPNGSDTVLTENKYKKPFTQRLFSDEFLEKDKFGNPVVNSSGDVTIALDDINETLTVNFNINFASSTDFLNGPIALLDDFIPDVIVGTITQSGASYIVSVQNNFLHISGSGNLTQVTDNFTVNLPAYSPDPNVLDDLCYQYHYDYRNRLIEKKIPGKDWESIVYDKLDRPVLTQDALLKQNNEWLFTKYDALGRVVYTGKLLDIDNNRSEFQALLNQETQLYEERNSGTNVAGTNLNYTNLAFPSQNIIEVLTVNYYDDYVDMGGLSLPTQNLYGHTITTNTKSLPTVSKVRVLDTNDWITTITGYDDKARPVYLATKNNYLSTTDTVDSNIDFVGKVLQSTTNHSKTNHPSVTTIDDFTYDHAGRLVSQKQEIIGQGQERIVENYYDELGQLYKKDVGGEFLFEGYTGIEGVTVSQDTNNDTIITKTSNSNDWDAGIATKGKISGDGYIEFKAVDATKLIMAGLSHVNTDNHYDTIEYAIYLRNNGKINVFENGINKGNFGYYLADDDLRVERVGSTIYYKHNDTTIYTSTISSTLSLLGDVSIHDYDGKVKNLNIQSSNLNTVLQTVDYTYNIRGWLKGINDNSTNGIGEDLFSFKLNYNNPTQGTALYNGNISETLWQTANDDKYGVDGRSYFYSYDALNRITEAIFDKTGGTNQDGFYNLKHVDYDKNGNIGVLRRSGIDPNNNDAFIDYMDNLTYSYVGNQLLKVAENAGHTEGFKDGTNTGDDYTYDANGNMLTDANKDITNISYNHLNLPTQVTTSNGNIQYIYDASGVKLKKLVNETSQSAISTIYAGNYIYEDTQANGEKLKFFSQPEGYTEPDANGGYNYVYQYKDHLGNVRLTYADANNDGAVDSSEILEENNYYPFGLKHKGYNYVINGTDHKYGFGGKEEQDELGLGWMDVTARNYDPAIGRWMNLDPLAEKMRRHSPYNFGFDNPIFFQDYDGMMPQGPGDPPNKIVKKAAEGLKKIVDSVMGMFDSNPDIEREKVINEGNNIEKSNAITEKNDEKNKAKTEFANAIADHSGDVAIGLAYSAADQAEELAEDVSDGANAITVASGGASLPVTGPVAKFADATASGAKIVKGTIHVAEGNYGEAAEMGMEATVAIGTTSAVNKTMKHVKKHSKLTKTQDAVQSTALSMFANIMTKIFLPPMIN